VRILVTGASGFVGGSFLRQFAHRADLELHGVSRRACALPNYTRVDLSQPFEIPFRPDVVIHAAARASPWGRSRDFEAQNVDATRNVIAFCERHAVSRLVYVSSTSVYYRDAHQLSVTESTPIGPTFINAYASTKYAGELLVNAYRGSHVIMRPRAVFGPGDTVLFPRVLAAAKRGALPQFTVSDGPILGDLIYIDMLCDYLLAAATKPDVANAYNVTNGQPIELQKLLHDVLHRLDLPLPTRKVPVHRAMRIAAAVEAVYRALRISAEPPVTRFGVSMFAFSRTFDVSRAVADFGPPSVSLEDGVSRFVAWQRAEWARDGRA
jgi:2-alkyl-3-oxoalkanoate reductase